MTAGAKRLAATPGRHRPRPLAHHRPVHVLMSCPRGNQHMRHATHAAWEKVWEGVRRMWRRRLIVLMGFGVLLVGPVSAQAGELPDGSNVVATATSAADDPVGTVTSTANDVVGTPNDAVGTVTTNAGDAVGNVTSTASGTAAHRRRGELGFANADSIVLRRVELGRLRWNVLFRPAQSGRFARRPKGARTLLPDALRPPATPCRGPARADRARTQHAGESSPPRGPASSFTRAS